MVEIVDKTQGNLGRKKDLGKAVDLARSVFLHKRVFEGYYSVFVDTKFIGRPIFSVNIRANTAVLYNEKYLENARSFIRKYEEVFGRPMDELETDFS